MPLIVFSSRWCSLYSRYDALPLQVPDFSDANRIAAAAAQLPLPPDEEALAAEEAATSAAKEEPAATPAFEVPPVAAPSGSGWGAALLQANKAASQKATAAVEAEIEKAKGGEATLASSLTLFPCLASATLSLLHQGAFAPRPRKGRVR